MLYFSSTFQTKQYNKGLPLITMLPSLLCLTATWHSHLAFRKQPENHLIDLISEPLGAELNLCPRVLEKGRERGRWKDHSATVNNVTV